jgi:phosphoribosylformylglycinamidine (FGAM) synthase-like enzyme
VSGNVSLYNESETTEIYPTPVVGMVGVIEDYSKRLGAGFVAEGDFALLVGTATNELGGSEYLKVGYGIVAGRPPEIDMGREKAVIDFILDAAGAGLLRSAHDVADGGLLVALAECCMIGGLGIKGPSLRPEGGVRYDALFFGESPGRFVVSASSRAMPELQTLARKRQVEVGMLGLIGGETLELEGQLQLSLVELISAWEGTLT